jgi:hypothetical protein
MSESQTERSFHDDDAVRDDTRVVEYPHGVASDTTAPLHEVKDAGIKVVGIAAAVVGGLVIVSLIAVALLTRLYYQSPDTQPQGGSAVEPATPPAAVEMRVNPLAAWQRYKAESDAELNGYDWVDQNAGVARIPITRAMSLITQGVQPVLGETNAAQPSPMGTPTP